MLNLKEIAERIESPALCQSGDVMDLEQLCITYPYSQVFPLLYLKCLAQNNDVRLDSELEKYACYIIDRTILYHLIHSSERVSILKEEVAIETALAQDPMLVEETIDFKVVAETEVSNIIETVQGEEIVIEFDVAENGDDDQGQLEPTLVSSFEVEKLESNEEIESEEIEPIESDISDLQTEHPDNNRTNEINHETAVESEFEEQLLSQALSAAYSIEKEEEKYLLEQKIKKESVVQEVISIEKTKEIEEPFEISRPSNSKKSFSTWLQSNSNYSEIKTEKIDPNELISKFIESNPKISRSENKLFEGRKEKVEFYSPVKKAKESLDEQMLPVSETLAKIFAAQGNFSKAIYAYQQLMLIIPEKKIFFAVQIEELEKKLNK